MAVQISMQMQPIPSNYEDQARWLEAALRRRMEEGIWEEDLNEQMRKHFPNVRIEAIGPVDMSSNPFVQITREMSVLYHTSPEVTHLGATDDQLSELFGSDGFITRSGLWQQQQNTQEVTLSMNEGCVRIDAENKKDGIALSTDGVRYRTVTSDMVIARASPDDPETPVYWAEYRLRDGEWYIDEFSIEDPENPFFRIRKASNGDKLDDNVITSFGLEEVEGDKYPYRDKDGNVFIPVVMYHAQKTGKLWNPYKGIQAVRGSLTASVLYTLWVHLMKDASWAQKYIVGAMPAGLQKDDTGTDTQRASIVTDQSSILVFVKDIDFQGQPMIGTFEVPADPESMLRAVERYTTMIALAAGLAGSDVSRKSGDARSGAALSVSRHGQRIAKKKFAPTFGFSDRELMAKSAMILNRKLGTNYPESGYRIKYTALPKSPDEIKAEREDVLAKTEAGYMSPIDGMIVFSPDMKRDEAETELLKIKADRLKYLIN